MSTVSMASSPLARQLKTFLVDRLALRDVTADTIADGEPLLGGRIGLDSLDAVELAMYLEEEFGIPIRSENERRTAFASIASLAGYVRGHTPDGSAVGQSLLPLALAAGW